MTSGARTVEANSRKADYPIDAVFLERWSPRAFTGEIISEDDLLTMLEAGRWAASCYNAQPWRMLYARRGTPHWDRFLGLLAPYNQSWAKNASALVVWVSNCLIRPPGAETDVPSHTHSFDTGTASGYFVLQAFKMGWFAHGMAGFDMGRAVEELKVPTDHRVEAMHAVGRRADKSTLPEALREREQPIGRLPLSRLAFEGDFAAGA